MVSKTELKMLAVMRPAERCPQCQHSYAEHVDAKCPVASSPKRLQEALCEGARALQAEWDRSAPFKEATTCPDAKILLELSASIPEDTRFMDYLEA